MFALSSTSALVLLWTQESIYESSSAKKFLRNVQLEAGQPLREELDKIWGHIDEEVTNRKFGVKKFCAEFLALSPDTQVIFLGAGLDPKSLDIAELFPRTLVFDVDMDNMDLKEEITKSIDGPQNIKFCQANIADAEKLTEALLNKGWNNKKTTLIVAEGITYYIDKESFKNAFSKLKTSNGGVVLEYSIPNNDIKTSERKDLYNTFFNTLQNKLGLPFPLVRYNLEEVYSLATMLGGKVTDTLNQQELEKERTGESNYYASDSGAVHVSFIQYHSS